MTLPQVGDNPTLVAAIAALAGVALPHVGKALGWMRARNSATAALRARADDHDLTRDDQLWNRLMQDNKQLRDRLDIVEQSQRDCLEREAETRRENARERDAAREREAALLRRVDDLELRQQVAGGALQKPANGEGR